MSLIELLSQWTPEAVGGLITGVCTGVSLAVIGIIKAINEGRKKKGIHTCCVTGRKLKPKKAKTSKQAKR